MLLTGKKITGLFLFYQSDRLVFFISESEEMQDDKNPNDERVQMRCFAASVYGERNGSRFETHP